MRDGGSRGRACGEREREGGAGVRGAGRVCAREVAGAGDARRSALGEGGGWVGGERVG